MVDARDGDERSDVPRRYGQAPPPLGVPGGGEKQAKPAPTPPLQESPPMTRPPAVPPAKPVPGAQQTSEPDAEAASAPTPAPAPESTPSLASPVSDVPPAPKGKSASQDSAPPVAQTARMRKQQTAPLTLIPKATPTQSVDPEVLAALQAGREQQRAARAEQARARAEKRSEWFKKNKLGVIIGAIVIVLIGAGAIVETISASNGSPAETVTQYIVAMNAKDPTAFSNKQLFPLPSGTELMPQEILAQMDTSLVDAKSSVKNTASGAEVSITATNLDSPVVLTLKKDLVWSGILLTQKWSVVDSMGTVKFAAAENLPGDASVSIGTYPVGTPGSPTFVAVTTPTFASPFGSMVVNTSATGSTAAASRKVFILPGENSVEFGAGAMDAYPVIQSALVNDDMSLLIPVMAKQVDLLMWPTQSGSAPRVQNLSPSDAASQLQSRYQNYMPLQWSHEVPAGIRTYITQLSVDNGVEEFLTPDSKLFWAVAGDPTFGNIAYISFTYNANGQVAKIWFAPTNLAYGSDFD